MVVAVLAVIVVGITAVIQIPADVLPQFQTPGGQIVTFYPGMPPEVMERDIMSRMERWTVQSVGIERQEGKAMLGVCIVKNFFRDGLSLETAMSQVTSYSLSDMVYLPPSTSPPATVEFITSGGAVGVERRKRTRRLGFSARFADKPERREFLTCFGRRSKERRRIAWGGR